MSHDSIGSAGVGARSPAAWRVLLRRLELALAVQAGEKTTLLLVGDSLILVQGIFAALLGGGEPRDFYLLTALTPLVLLGPLALSDLVAVERRSGTLDLTLTTGSREAIFAMRTGTIAALMWAQGTAVVLVVWATEPQPVPLLGPILQLGAVSAFTGAAALFWSVYLKGAGGAWLATMGTLVVFARWTFFNPLPPRVESASAGWWPRMVEGAVPTLVGLIGAAALLAAYALRRLRRPETLL